MRGHREGEAYVHAARIVLHRGVDKLLDLGEGDDLIELARDLRPPHAQDGAIQKDVVAAGQFRVKSRADFEEDPTRPQISTLPRVGSVMRERIFSSVLLPAPLRPMMPDHFAALDFERTSFSAQIVGFSPLPLGAEECRAAARSAGKARLRRR